MIIPKFIIDQSVINNEIRVLNAHLSQQRQLKQTLLLYLNKISDGLYTSQDERDTTSLISCLKGIQSTFENIKDNIAKLIELKEYLENALSMNEYNSDYFDKYNKEYMDLFNKISEDNIFYYSFMESLLKFMNVTFPSDKKFEVPTADEVVEKLESFNNQGKHALIEEDLPIYNVNVEDNNKPESNTTEVIEEKNEEVKVELPHIAPSFSDNSVESILDDDFVDAGNYSQDTTVVEAVKEVAPEAKFETKKFDFDLNTDTIKIPTTASIKEPVINAVEEVVEPEKPVQENVQEIIEEPKEPEVVETIKEEPKEEIKQAPSMRTAAEMAAHSAYAQATDGELHEKTLLVSEKLNNVVLPYSTQDLEDYFSANPEKYSSLQDIIDKEYTLPLTRFKNQTLSRFKEAYNLARNKSGYSHLQALKIANEVMFNSNLDPTIITACKNVEELEMYLGCLEDNDLASFKCFKIVYDLI